MRTDSEEPRAPQGSSPASPLDEDAAPEAGETPRAKRSLGGTLGNALLLAVALVFLSTVTIFNPETVTNKVLRRIIPEPQEPETRPKPAVPRRFVDAIETVTEENLRNTVEDLVAFGTRVPGYGAAEAEGRLPYEYVRDRFAELGLEGVTVETFKVTVPVDEGASVALPDTGERLPIHCLWPNQVKPPSLREQGLTGRLVYGGRGQLEDFKHRVGPPPGGELQAPGAIVLMDFDCGMNYIEARSLGAQAIIFIDHAAVTGEAGQGRSGVTRGEAGDKFLPVPVDIPRYYAEGDTAKRLYQLAQEGSDTVTVKARMVWR